MRLTQGKERLEAKPRRAGGQTGDGRFPTIPRNPEVSYPLAHFRPRRAMEANRETRMSDHGWGK